VHVLTASLLTQLSTMLAPRHHGRFAALLGEWLIMGLALRSVLCRRSLYPGRRNEEPSQLDLMEVERSKVRSGGQCGRRGKPVASTEFGVQIVNGQEAQECVWTWQVGFRYNDNLMPFCGGTIVAPSWVLTAAHCGIKQGHIVVAGEWRPKETSGNEQNRKVKSSTPHPLYNNDTHSHDFALVKVNKKFRFNNCVGAACLPSSDVVVGAKCSITGWGTLSSQGSESNVLQEAEVKTRSNRKYGSYDRSLIDDSMLLAQGKAGNKIIDACQGDSGGPLVCESNGQWTLHGATSWGYGCAEAKYPGVWARVNYVMDWVNLVMEG